MQHKLGFAVSGGLTATQIVDCARRAEALGYESMWVAEGHGGDQFAILSACALATERIRLGTAISSIFVRSLPTIAMAAATLDDLSGGRFVLGLGSSHRVQVEAEHGLTYDRPLSRVREAISFLRQLLAEGSIGRFEGEFYRSEGFDFWFEPSGREIPIYISGLFSKMLRLCGETSDGLILTRTSLDKCESVIEQVAEGARAANRAPGAVEITSLFPAAVAENRTAAFDQLRPSTAQYAGFFPRYNRLMAESGFPEAAAAIALAWKRGDAEAAAAAVPDELIDATAIAGTRDEVRNRIERYREAGIELPILSPRTRTVEDFHAVLEACAP